MSNDFAAMERYRLQLQKSISIQIKPKSTKMTSAPVEYTLGKDQMPNVERAICHLAGSLKYFKLI
jgi:hypothetical protein